MVSYTVTSRRHFLRGSEDTDGIRRGVGEDAPHKDPVTPSGWENWQVPWAW